MRIFLVVAIAGAALTAAATAATPTLTLSAAPTVVVYGKAVTLTGQLSTQKANQTVGIEATACGTTKAARLTTAKTAATGAYSASVAPALATVYQATSKNLKSPTVSVSVKPVLQLTRPKRGSFVAKLTAGQAMTGKFVLFQRYAKLKKRWVQVKRVALGAAVPGPTKPTMITSASFKAKLARGTRVRVLISKAQAAPCYLTAASRSLRA